jgi:hypothetical protein
MVFSCRFLLGRLLRCVFFNARVRNDKSSSPETKLVSQLRLRFWRFNQFQRVGALLISPGK